MALILTECLPCNLVSQEGILRQPELDRLVLIVCEAVTSLLIKLAFLAKTVNQ